MSTRSASPDDTRLEDLFSRWRYRRHSDTPATPEELCLDCPELLDALRARIAALALEQPHDLYSASTVNIHQAGRDTLPPLELPRIPGYEVFGVLGRGGMGTVFQARQLGADRLVAIKMLNAADAALPEEVARFRHEARALARINHPNIVQVYEVGDHNGLPFFSMEYVEGGPLSRHLDGKPLPARDAAALVQTLACAMHVTHQRGILHRDLKPSNVLLASGGCEPSEASPPSGGSRPPQAGPKIADFGLAKHLGRDLGQTPPGSVLGTPSYMAPEQAGQKPQLGPPADVYSLGAILYECLTGKPPFREERPVDTLMKALSRPPEPPSSIASGVPAALEAICLKCLEKQPGDRYSSALALADDLSRFLRGEPVRGEPSWPVRIWRSVARHPRIALGLAAAVVLVGVALAFYFLHPRRQLEALQRELKEGRTAVLVPEIGPPRWSEWVEGRDEATFREEGGKPFRIATDSIALVDLLETVPVSRYRLSAEMSVNLEGMLGQGGLQIARGTVQTPDGPVHIFIDVSYLRGLPPPAKPLPEVHVNLRRLGRKDKDGLNATWLLGGAAMPKEVAPGEWVRVVADVSPERLRVSVDNRPVIDLSRDQMDNLLKKFDRVPRGPHLGPGGTDFQAALGLFVHNAAVTFRSVTIEPLEN